MRLTNENKLKVLFFSDVHFGEASETTGTNSASILFSVDFQASLVPLDPLTLISWCAMA